jgi:superfamily II DNA/RNA helicase
MAFSSLGLAPWLQQQCAALAYAQPTPVQLACVPPALAGALCL